jgi:putative permease
MIDIQDSGKRKVLFLLLGCVVVIIIFFVGGAAQMLLISALLAYLLDPIVTSLESKGLSRTTATTLFMVSLLAIIALTFAFMIPLIIHQIKDMQSNGASEQTAKAIAKLEGIIREKLGFLGLADLNLAEKIKVGQEYIGGKMVEVILKDSVAVIIEMVTIPFFIFLLLKDGREIKKQFVRLVPNRYFEFTLDLIYKMDQQLGNYLRGQCLDALVFGSLTTIALWLLGVKYFIFIGIFAGLANLIPYVGPIAGVTPAVLVSLLDDGDVAKAFYIILAFIFLKLTDDVLIQPMVVAQSVSLHPMVVFLSIIIGGHLFGILGMLIAVPFTGFLKVVLSESTETLRKYRFT